MTLKFLLLVGLCLLGTTFGFVDERARYDNYRVYKVTPSNKAALDILREFETASDSIIFMKSAYAIDQVATTIVAPHKLPDFLEILKINRIEYELIERNLESQLNRIQQATYSSRSSRNYDWTAYHQLDDTYDWLKSLVRKYPNSVSLIEGGRTYENRSILGIKISYRSGNKGIFIEAGIHAREWISPATSTFIINQLLTSNVSSVRDIAENYDWYIFPHTNPDGYVHTHNGDRLWRMTRKPYGIEIGADPNRNWDIHWKSTYTYRKETYPGPYPFSEIETKTLSDYILSIKEKIQLYISLHSHAQYLMYPYGYTNKLPLNVKNLEQVFKVSIDAISKRHGTKYIGGNVYTVIYPAFGSSIDWVYDKAGIKMAFVYELRPIRFDPIGFILPPSEIIPTGEETLDSVTAMIGEVKRLGYFN